MRLNFTGRLSLTVGLSTLIFSSLYWLIGWHYVEGVEESHRHRVLDYLGERIDSVVAGDLPPEAIEFMGLATLYMDSENLPANLQSYAQPQRPGAFDLPDGDLLLVRPSPLSEGVYFAHLDGMENLLTPEDSEFYEAALVVGGILLFTLGVVGLTLSLIWYQTRPIRELTRAVADVNPARPEITPLERDDDLGKMSHRIAELLQRIRGFIDRERNFTRFASHELRSPLMVIRSSIDLLQEAGSRDPFQQRAMARIDVAVARMAKLLEAFLWLSREEGRRESDDLDKDQFNQVIAQIQHLTPGLADRLEVESADDIRWPVDQFVLSVILDNLLRNALDHGEGTIQLTATATGVVIVNRVASNETVPGSHFGYGLQIVALLCEKSGCRFERDENAGLYQTRLIFA